MFWEFIATIFAGMGAAGIALTLRFLSRKKLATWWIPIAAGVGMLSFQIYTEYTWFEHQKTLLPPGVDVVRTAEQTAFWRPWSYVFPQTLRFIAADLKNASHNEHNPDLVRLNLYLFERRMAARKITTVIHCRQQARADYHEQLHLPAQGEALSSEWYVLAPEDPMLQVCR
ncbi:MAG: hypothetical protein LAT66_12555 [Alkalimonas sp.]|nr:hypothetical protein [Alkalimonas sp.]